MDSEHEDEVLTFREVFLGSRALELLLAGFIAEAPCSDEEHALLASLLGSTLGGDAALHQVRVNLALQDSTAPAPLAPLLPLLPTPRHVAAASLTIRLRCHAKVPLPVWWLSLTLAVLILTHAALT